MHTATGFGNGIHQDAVSPLQDALTTIGGGAASQQHPVPVSDTPSLPGRGGVAAATRTDTVAHDAFSRSQEQASASAPAPAERSRFDRFCSFFRRNVQAAGRNVQAVGSESHVSSPAGHSSSVDSATDEAGAPRPSRNNSSFLAGIFQFFRRSDAASLANADDASSANAVGSSEGVETSSSVKEPSRREQLNTAKKTFNAAIEKAIKVITDPNATLGQLERLDDYLREVSPRFYSEARAVIDEALTRAKEVRILINYRDANIHKTVTDNELDTICNDLRATKKETEFGINLFEASKKIGDFASYDMSGAFDRHLKDRIERLDSSFTEFGVFKKIAKFAYSEVPGEPLKALNAYIHDTSNDKYLRGLGTIAAAIAGVVSNALSFSARVAVLVVAVAVQALFYKKILPVVALLGGIGAALAFGGIKAAAGAVVIKLIFSCCCTAVGTALISTAVTAYSHIKLKRELSNPRIRDDMHAQQLQAQLDAYYEGQQRSRVLTEEHQRNTAEQLALRAAQAEQGGEAAQV